MPCLLTRKSEGNLQWCNQSHSPNKGTSFSAGRRQHQFINASQDFFPSIHFSSFCPGCPSVLLYSSKAAIIILCVLKAYISPPSPSRENNTNIGPRNPGTSQIQGRKISDSVLKIFDIYATTQIASNNPGEGQVWTRSREKQQPPHHKAEVNFCNTHTHTRTPGEIT